MDEIHAKRADVFSLVLASIKPRNNKPAYRREELGLPLVLLGYMKGRQDLIAPQDLKYVKVDPDSAFDPEHNKTVIEKTIKDNEKLVKARTSESLEKVAERNNALAIYLRSLNQGGKATNREKFFGKKYTAYLRGKEIMENIKGQMMLQGRSGRAFVIKPSEIAKSRVKYLKNKGVL